MLCRGLNGSTDLSLDLDWPRQWAQHCPSWSLALDSQSVWAVAGVWGDKHAPLPVGTLVQFEGGWLHPGQARGPLCLGPPWGHPAAVSGLVWGLWADCWAEAGLSGGTLGKEWKEGGHCPTSCCLLRIRTAQVRLLKTPSVSHKSTICVIFNACTPHVTCTWVSCDH